MWYTSSEEYSQWPSYVHPEEPILGGVIDGVIDEMFGIPMACKTIYELATDKQKLKALSNIFTQSGLKELLKGLKEELKETINDEEKQDHFAGQSTVSVVSMMSGTGFITKVGKIDEVSKVATKAATEIGEPKAIIALQEVKTPKNKALRNVANEKAMKELAEEAGMDFIAEHADEISDLARFDKIDVSADLWKKLRERGQKFNRVVSNKRPPKYDFHEVRIEVTIKVKGKYVVKEYFLDSYQEGVAIVSRKATDFNKIQLKTFEGYCNELLRKYPVGAKITTAKDGYENIVGKTLQGIPTIEVPKINELSSRLEEFQKIADKYGIKLVFEVE